MTALARLAEASRAVAASPARSAKVAALAECLRGVEPADVPVAVAYLSGELPQRRTGIGYAGLRDLPPPAAGAGRPALSVAEVDEALERIAGLAGAGSQAQRRRLLADLLGRAGADERRLLVGLVGGELRQGALDGVMTEAVARAAGVPLAAIRRAGMLRGALGPVAQVVLSQGRAGLERFGLQVGRPVQPMLAATAESLRAALERSGPAAVEWKIDGIRIQVHRRGLDVRVFSRSLDDITARVPEVVESALGLPVAAAVLDGEVIALAADGRPRPFQVTAARVSSRTEVAQARARAPLSAYFFDVLHLDGTDLLGESGATRHAELRRVVPEPLLVPRIVPDADSDAAARFLAAALARGHEGVMVKSLSAPYEAGRRGAGWLKVKPRHTLDLVVLAAEWGHGRRRGWLSNLHLGARDPDQGYVMLGKTFKGLTDAMLAWQTERLLGLAQRRDDWTVYVRPELVVEVAFDGVQTSPRYPGGVALRFARVLRHRPDKTAADADTLEAVRAVHSAGEDTGPVI